MNQGMNVNLFRVVIITMLCAFSFGVRAEMMTVQDLKKFLAKGEAGELAATSYVNGVVDGMLGLDSLHQKERKTPKEFCRFYEAQKAGKPIRHPAYRTRELVNAWEKQGHPMNTLAVDFVLAFMTAQYGCEVAK